MKDIEWCATCKVNMVLRENKKTHEKFWGCPNYPKCRWTKPIFSLTREYHPLPREYDQGTNDEYQDEPGFCGFEGPFKWS